MKMDGKTVVVTGAASGIGLATAEAMVQAGATVIMADLALEKGRAEAERLRAAGHDARCEQLDVSSPESVTSFARRVLAQGEVHVLVNCAGWGKPRPSSTTNLIFGIASSTSISWVRFGWHVPCLSR